MILLNGLMCAEKLRKVVPPLSAYRKQNVLFLTLRLFGVLLPSALIILLGFLLMALLVGYLFFGLVELLMVQWWRDISVA